ncbi:unnamed protein product, partial [Closterium sp. Naga37s-1]
MDQIVPAGDQTDGKLSRGVLLCAAGIIAKSDLTKCVADGGLAGTDAADLGVAGGESAATTAAGTVPGGDWGGGEQQQPSYIPEGAKSVKCRKKIVISLAVSNGHVGPCAIHSFKVTPLLGDVSNGAKSVKCSEEDRLVPCCLQRSLEGGKAREAVKTPVYAVYPLTFLQSFNGRPYEVVVTTMGCRDGAYDSNPTCGWFLYPDGSRVPNSQVNPYFESQPVTSPEQLGSGGSDYNVVQGRCSGGDTWKESIVLDNPQQFRADLD